MSKICHAIILQTTRHYYAHSPPPPPPPPLPGAIKSQRGPHISIILLGPGGPKFTVKLGPGSPFDYVIRILR